MRFEHTNTYPASAEAVLAMLTDRDFRERVCRAQHALSHTVTVTGSGVGATVVVEQEQSMKGAPGVATKLTGDSVRLVQREAWTGAQRADLEIEIPGKPGHLRGTVVLEDHGRTCEAKVEGEVKVGIPIVGRKLEDLISQIFTKALVREGREGVAWLEERA